jgi:hypothetical protein
MFCAGSSTTPALSLAGADPAVALKEGLVHLLPQQTLLRAQRSNCCIRFPSYAAPHLPVMTMTIAALSPSGYRLLFGTEYAFNKLR